MSGLVGVPLSRRFLVSVLATGFFLGTSLAVSGVVGAQQTETMNASWYGPGFEGLTTANGEVFDPSGFTAAHKTLPFGTTLEVCYEGCVNVRINDRGPFIEGRDLDLAQGAADAIGLTAVGHAVVNVTYTDGSAPAGPSGETAEQTVAPAAESEAPATQPEAPAAQPEALVAEPEQSQTSNITQAESAADGQYAAADDQYDDGTAAEDQYATAADDDQYAAADDQYSQPTVAQSAPVAEALAPLAPPEPAAVEVAPLELATPGSTVERRIVLALAAPPENYAGALPDPSETASIAQNEAPAEEAPAGDAPDGDAAAGDAPDGDAPANPPSGSVAAVAGLTVLPDTGGLPLAPLAGAAALLACLMLVGVRVFRR